MIDLPASIIEVVALLTFFLVVGAGLRYAVPNNFARTRLIMTLYFFFIVTTLTLSFGQYTAQTLPYTIPAAAVGMLLGYLLGVKTEQQKLRMQGLGHYVEHFSHIHITDISKLNWWSVINFYTIMGGLLLLNLVGLSTVIFGGAENTAILASAVGAFLLGSIVPYLAHLWSISAKSAERKG